MSSFSVSNNGIVLIDNSGDAIFVPSNYLSIFIMELEGIGSDNTLGTMSTFGFINMSFTDSGVHIGDDKEGVFLSKNEAETLLSTLGN
ncbi:MAG: hypothetical protein PWR29_915 [Methanolobus sp.]|jgi:hypothetical protein|nr:hypothetical protein [Methanolobus sp.]MDK2834661.1 hypothetical protein [Methanolobus sp.]MDK2911958.1 hypothetical protein [Methanolobus sp.]MDN5309640.1 hypothetical protein [Methanolobus sp.]